MSFGGGSIRKRRGWNIRKRRGWNIRKRLGWMIWLHSHPTRWWGDGLVRDIVPLPIIMVEVRSLILAGRHREDTRERLEGRWGNAEDPRG